MKRKDLNKLSLPSNCRIVYRSNWHGARVKTIEGNMYIKGSDYIEDIERSRRYSYRCLVSVEEIQQENK